MTSLTTDGTTCTSPGRTGPPIRQALVVFVAASVILLVPVGAHAVGSIELPDAASHQFGVVATTIYVITGLVAAYRAWAIQNLRAALVGAEAIGPGAIWSWLTFVDVGPASRPVNGLMLIGASILGVVLVVNGIRRSQWLEMFGGLGSLVVSVVAAAVQLEPTTARTGSAALMAAVAGMICLYGLLADLEVSEFRSLTELLETRRQIEVEVARVEDLLHDLRSGLLAIETAIGSFDDDLAVPLRAEAARLRSLTLSGARRVDRFDLAGAVGNLVAARRASGLDIKLRCPSRAEAWGEPTEILAIVENLLSNAERHGRWGPILVTIEADGTGRGGGTVRLSVTSPGVVELADPEDIFRRGVTTHPDGQGLGLARARMLAGVNGAELRLAPAGAGCTTFVLTLRSTPPAAVA